MKLCRGLREADMKIPMADDEISLQVRSLLFSADITSDTTAVSLQEGKFCRSLCFLCLQDTMGFYIQ